MELVRTLKTQSLGLPAARTAAVAILAQPTLHYPFCGIGCLQGLQVHDDADTSADAGSTLYQSSPLHSLMSEFVPTSNRVLACDKSFSPKRGFPIVSDEWATLGKVALF